MTIKEHSKIGSDLISQVGELGFLSRTILHHHERWDGKGYPHCLEGDNIPFQSRILFVCDCYHALISNRPYRKALTKKDIHNIFRIEQEKQFDPYLVEEFLAFIDK